MPRESIESLCQKAQQALARGQYDEARQTYLQALGLKSDSPDVHYGLATVCFLLNDLTAAVHHFQEVTRLDPLRAGAFINLGAVYNRLDRLDEAIPVLRRGIQIDHNRAEGYYNLGVVYRRKGQPDLAIQAYREATRVNPRMADAYYNLGNLFLQQEQFSLAVNHYRHALELRPNWEKAERGLEQAEAAMRTADKASASSRSRTVEQATAPTVAIDVHRTIDPHTHNVLLTTLHKATIESESLGRSFVKILESEIEPAIKELSTCLLYPDSSSGELDHCVQKFETAIAAMQSAQRTLQTSMERVRVLGQQLLKS
jgi:Tfp pilus assembly protein PilF/exonuclease VII small subunit